MKLKLQASHVKLLSRCFGKVVQNRVTLPVLACALFRYDDTHGLTAAVSNLDEELTIGLPDEAVTDNSDPRAFLVPYAEIKRLTGVLKKDEAATVEPGKDSILVGTVVDGRTLTREMAALPPEEFPAIHGLPGNAAAADIAAFLTAYRTVLRAASNDTSRATLHSVFWNYQEKTLVATDGRRLCMVPLSGFPAASDLIIPPTKLLGNGILEGVSGTVAVEEENTCPAVHFSCGAVHYRVRCMASTYPNYKQVIPADQSNWLGEIRVHDLDLPALRSACTQFAGGEDGTGTVALYAENGRLACISMAEVSADVQRPHLILTRSTATVKQPLLCAVNSQYFIDGLDAGCSRIRFMDPYTPLRFDGATGALYVLMPLRDVPAAVTAFVGETFSNPAVPVTAQPKEESEVKKQPATTGSATAAEPASTTGTATATEELPAESAAQSPAQEPGATADPVAVTGRPPLTFAPDSNPEDELIADLNAVQERVNELQTTLRSLRQKVRAVGRYYRGRAREIETKTQLIAKFKEAVSF
jgi:DNA polymerase III sliding clamp (beta) subunit (PCNA family)